MKRYENHHGSSGITAYDIDQDSITVVFRDGAKYLYTSASAGMDNVERMKTLAEQGYGLNEFINRTVRKRYAKKLR